MVNTPPCGRIEAKISAYPKCRGYAVARRMSDEAKRKACSQKRRAEKKEPKIGKGNKPTMVSHKKNKISESVLYSILNNILFEQENDKRIWKTNDKNFKNILFDIFNGNSEKFSNFCNKRYDKIIINGYLGLDYFNIKQLPNNLTINGPLHLKNSEIETLPKNLKVDGSIDIRNTNIRALPIDLKHSNGFIWINGTPLNDNDRLANTYIDVYNLYRF